MKMKIKYGMAACMNNREEAIMWSQVGKYLLVGFTDMNSKFRMPVWRKVG